jgi:PhnB protein
MFKRNCGEALAAYAEAFGVAIAEKQCYGDMPPTGGFTVAEEDKGLVLHSRLMIDGTEIMCADSTDRHQPGDNMYITLTTTNAAQVHQAWEVLKQGGEVYMELTPTFFAAAHGSLRDRFGVNWMFTVPA